MEAVAFQISLLTNVSVMLVIQARIVKTVRELKSMEKFLGALEEGVGKEPT